MLSIGQLFLLPFSLGLVFSATSRFVPSFKFNTGDFLLGYIISRKVELPIKISLENTSRPFADIRYFFTSLFIDDMVINMWYWR